MPNYRKLKIHNKSDKKKLTPVNHGSDSNVIIEQPKLTAADQEVLDKINELHTFLTQRGVPYFCVAQTPDTKYPAGKFSFNHEHNKPEQTMRNAEWIFVHLGDMLSRATNGIVRIIRQY